MSFAGEWDVRDSELDFPLWPTAEDAGCIDHVLFLRCRSAKLSFRTHAEEITELLRGLLALLQTTILPSFTSTRGDEIYSILTLSIHMTVAAGPEG